MSFLRFLRLTRFTSAVLVGLAFLAAATPVWAAAGTIVEYPTPTPQSQPSTLAVGPDNNIWFSEATGGNLGRMNRRGQITEFPVGDVHPAGVATGADGNLWFVELNTNAIGVMNLSGQVIATYPIPTPNSNPGHIILDRSTGLLWFTEYVGGKIASITTAGKITEYPLPRVTPAPIDLAVGASNVIYYIDPNNNVVGKLTASNGRIRTFTIPTAGSGPNRLTRSSAGNLYFTEAYTNKIGEMTPAGVFSEFPIPTSNGEPGGIAIGPDGNLWYCELAGNQIGRMTLTGSSLGEFPLPTPNAGCDNVIAGPGAGAPMYFSEVFASNVATVSTR